MLALLFQANDLYRDVTRDWVQLELIQHGPAEHVRQKDIKRDRRWFVLASERKRRGSAGTDNAFEALIPRQIEEDPRIVDVILYDQKNGIAIRD